MQVIFRPLPVWPHQATTNRRSAQFRATWSKTLQLLEYELVQLHAHSTLFGVGLEAADIRLDGLPRANARPMIHPGVELSFQSRFGRLVYATDAYYDWRDNVRAIALSLEALRAVDRYGVSKRGEQYAGWAMLEAGGGKEERGRELIAQHGSVTAALRATHPDTGGETASVADFDAVMVVKRAETP